MITFYIEVNTYEMESEMQRSADPHSTDWISSNLAFANWEIHCREKLLLKSNLQSCYLNHVRARYLESTLGALSWNSYVISITFRTISEMCSGVQKYFRQFDRFDSQLRDSSYTLEHGLENDRGSYSKEEIRFNVRSAGLFL